MGNGCSILFGRAYQVKVVPEGKQGGEGGSAPFPLPCIMLVLFPSLFCSCVLSSGVDVCVGPCPSSLCHNVVRGARVGEIMEWG